MLLARAEVLPMEGGLPIFNALSALSQHRFLPVKLIAASIKERPGDRYLLFFLSF